jgi:hypothetical protein
VAAGDQQRDQRELDVGLGQEAGIEMRLHVVDADEGHLPHEGQRLGHADPDQESAGQPGAHGGGHSIDLAPVDPRLDQRLGHGRR